MTCLYRGKGLNGQHVCIWKNRNCGWVSLYWCNRTIPIILFFILAGLLSYGIVHAWQGAEDRVEAARGEAVGAKILRLHAEIEKERKKKALVVSILECESGLRHEGVWGDGGKSYGIAQIQERTFKWLSEKAGTHGNWQDAGDQVALLSWAIDNGYADHWACYNKVVTHGSN